MKRDGFSLCQLCDEEIGPHDVVSPALVNGEAVHHECLFRSVMGGANHLLNRCTCCGGTYPPDPPGLTRREAARLAMVTYWEMNPILPKPYWVP